MKGFTKFDIIIGHQETKYDGFISNLNVFEYDENLDIMRISSNPCQYDGSYLSWKDMEFDWVGDVTVKYFRRNSVCVCSSEEEKNKINVPLPSTMNFNTANELCKYFPDGIITEFQNQEDLESLSLLDNFPRCDYYWTPYSGALKIVKKYASQKCFRSRRRGLFQKY